MTQDFASGLVGLVLDGRYRLDALLGEGGMGAVYRAHHLAMDRRVAVKLLKPHLTTDEAALQRFAREARSTLKVDSPHAVKVLDFGVTPQRDYYMVLEYLDGRTVQRELDVDGPFDPKRVLHIAKHALLALGASHRSGLIHRDVKPDNILLMRVGDDPDYTKVLDFGVAKLMEGAAHSSKSALSITQAGMVFGTPEFMSPEQACGQTLDGRSDLYSLAATMFAMLTGCGMYQAKSAIEWLTCHARTPPPHLAEGRAELESCGHLDQMMQRCLAKRPEQRPATADEMVQMIAAVEPTLGWQAAGAQRVARPRWKARFATAFSTSSFIAALPAALQNTLEPSCPDVTARLAQPTIFAVADRRPGRSPRRRVASRAVARARWDRDPRHDRRGDPRRGGNIAGARQPAGRGAHGGDAAGRAAASGDAGRTGRCDGSGRRAPPHDAGASRARWSIAAARPHQHRRRAPYRRGRASAARR